MKKYATPFLFFVFAISTVQALTPGLKLTATGNGDSVLIETIGEPNVPVELYYTSTKATMEKVTLGTTDAQGIFSKVISTATYSIDSYYKVTLVVGYQEFQDQKWPYRTRPPSPPIRVSPAIVTLTPGEKSTIAITGGGEPDSIPSVTLTTSETKVADPYSFADDMKSVVLIAKSIGTTTIQICLDDACASVFVVVKNEKVQTPFSSGTDTKFIFSQTMSLGSTGPEVVELQKFLIRQKYLKSTATGYYGNLTIAAVRKFQKNAGISQTGAIGPVTRSFLNR